MLKRLLIALLLLAAVFDGGRQAVAAVQGAIEGHAVAAMSIDHHHGRSSASQHDAHHGSGQDGLGVAACLAMAGCFPPAIGAGRSDPPPVRAATRWTPWAMPAGTPTARTPAPDLRPPRAVL